MRTEILDSPDFSFVKVQFEAAGEAVVAEAGAMVSRSGQVEMKTQMRGGLGAALKRKVLGGETIFQNTFVASGPDQEVLLAPAIEGDVRRVDLSEGQVMFLQRGAYLAHVGEGLVLDTKWGGFKGFFGGTGLFLVKVVGPGELFYCGYGALREVPIQDSEVVVDNEHVVGFTEGLDYNVEKFGGFKGLLFSGEGLITRFRGTGTVILQTRNPSGLAGFLEPFRPTRSSN